MILSLKMMKEISRFVRVLVLTNLKMILTYFFKKREEIKISSSKTNGT